MAHYVARAKMNKLLGLILFPFLVLACSEAPLATGVQHLDPRLADGQSPADVLKRKRKLFASWTVENEKSDLAPWFLHEPCLKVAARDGAAGVLVGDVETEPGVFPRIRLSWRGSVQARDFNVIELDMRKYHRSAVRLAWRLASDPVDEPLGRHAVDLTLDSTGKQESVAISLEGNTDWRGEIVEITFTPCAEGPQRFEFSGMRFVQVGFAPGPDGLELEREVRGSGDGGLIAVGLETRRTWPSDWDVPLFAEVAASRDALLSVDTAIPGVLADSPFELHFAIDVRTPKTKWIQIAERVFVPRDEEDPTAWTPLLADLSPWEGEDLKLRFRNFRHTDEGAKPEAIGLGGELVVARAYWGAPMVVAKLQDDRRPNVILVTVDTLRADRVGKRTPFMDRMRREGQSFSNAWSACNSTTPSHSSILTGVQVADHGVIDNYSMLSPENVALAELLRAKGYHTAAAVSVRHLQAGSSGLGQGMDQFLLAAPRASTNGGITLEAVQAWLREWREIGDRPFFLWVHFFDPHTPYGPPELYMESYLKENGLELPPKEGSGGLPESHYTQEGQFLHGVTNLDYATFLYDAGVSYSDLLLSELWGTVEDLDWAEETMLFVTADHGESLGEHEHFFHHTDIFEGVMHVPLLAMIPGEASGVTIDDPVSTLDIAETLRLRLRLGDNVSLRGKDLFGARDPEREIFFAHSHLQQLGTCDDNYYFIATVADYEQLGRDHRIPKGTRELFDRVKDPELTNDISDSQPDISDRYDARVREWRESAIELKRVRRDLTEAQQSELERLGYTDSSKPQDD